MKTTITLFAVLFIWALSISRAKADEPTYVLNVRNMTLNSPVDNEVTFDIYMMRTSDCSFLYMKGRFEFTFNPLIANGGTVSYSFVPGHSDLPCWLYPQQPSVSSNKLMMQYNGSNGDLTFFPISASFPGTLICRMKLKTTASAFGVQPLSLKWNNPGSGINPVSRVFAFSNFFMRDVTTGNTHQIDSSGLGGTLPVELSGFTSSINKNSVTLNWSTSSELNNSGFDIERMKQGSDWTKIGFINGNGTTNSPVDYTYNDRSLLSGKYSYRLKQIDYNGNTEYFSLNSEINIGVPDKFDLSQNYPNPFNPTTSVNYDIPFDGKVSLKIFDMTGKMVSEYVNEFRTAGYYKQEINAGELSSGTYLYRLTSEGNSQNYSSVKKMILIK